MISFCSLISPNTQLRAPWAKNEKLVAAFAKVLKDRRKAAGLSQEELAFRADLSMSYISLLETKNRQPTLTVLEVLARELGLSLSELIDEVDTENTGHEQTSTGIGLKS